MQESVPIRLVGKMRSTEATIASTSVLGRRQGEGPSPAGTTEPFFRPCGTCLSGWAFIPALKRWAIIRSHFANKPDRQAKLCKKGGGMGWGGGF